MTAHQSFRPSDFAWRELPLILVNAIAAPLIRLLRAAGFWPETRRAERHERWRTRFWRAFLVFWLLLPISSLLVSGLSAYGLGQGWFSRSTSMALSRPAFLIIGHTPFKDRFGYLLSSLLNQGLKDSGRRMSDIR